MFWLESEGGPGPVATESRSKADVLRGVVTDRLSTAVREILAVVETTVAEYEEEAAGFRQEIDRQRQALRILLESQVKIEPANVCPGEQQLCPVRGVKEEEEAGGAENPEQDGHLWNDQQLCPVSERVPVERLVNAEEARGKENPEQDQHVWGEQLVNQLHPESQDVLVKTPGKIAEEGGGRGGESPEDDEHMSYGEFENLGLVSYIEDDDDDEGEELPPLRCSPKQKNKRPRPLPRSGTRTSLRLRMNDPKEFIQLRLCVLPDPHITGVSHSKLLAYPTMEVSCPVGLQQEEFLNLLRVTFPQINNNPFDLFWTDNGRKLLPLHVETLTAEEIQRNLNNTNQPVYIRLQGEVESNVPAVSSRPVTTHTTKIRFVARSRARKGTDNGQDFIDLEILIPDDSDVGGQSSPVKSSKQVKVVRCPLGLKEEDFLSQLKSLFPQLAGNEIIELFQTNHGSDLVPLNTTTLTPEEIWKSISADGPGSTLCVQKKATRTAAGVVAEEVSSPAHRSETHMDQMSCSETLVKQVVLKDSNPVELMHHMHQSAHDSQLNLSVVPPVSSCTEGEQRHNPRTLGIKPGLVTRVTVMSAKPKQKSTTQGVRSILYKGFSGDLPALSVLRTTRTAAGVIDEVSSPAHQVEAHMDLTSCPENPVEQIKTDCQNEEETLKKRCIKSIMMKEECLKLSDELSDTSCSDVSMSADEYVPDTASESEDSDDGRSPRPKQTLPLLNNPGSMSPPVCDSITSEVTGAEPPCSSQEVMDAVVVGTVEKKNGCRVYNKRQYCLYCSKPYAKMARHLASQHKDKSEVAKALSFPTSSLERKKELNYIRKKGNYAHNAAVMESGKGVLVPCKRPTKEAKGNDFVHCVYCQGLFTRPFLWKHIRCCDLRPASATLKPGKNRVQSMCVNRGPMPSHMSKQLWEVMSVMIPDPITQIIKNDRVITDLGQHLLNTGGMSDSNQQYVRVKMRELGRLIHHARNVTALKKMVDFVHPKNYLEMVKAVKNTCGFDSETNKFLIPSLAYKMGHTLVKISRLLKAQGLMSNNDELVRNATQFQKIHSEKWNKLITATALKNIAEAKWNVPALMPFTEDVQKMHQFLSQMQDECTSALSECPSTKAWADLTKVCLTQTILFNRRREGEVESMPLSAFLSRDSTEPHEDVDWALSEVEKKLCRHFSRIIIRGKPGGPVPILLTHKMLSALELLAKHRETCGVLKDNLYMFAQPAAVSHFCGSDCMRDFAKVCGAKCPKSLASTKWRKHAAILSTVLNMTDTEMDQLANFLGHDISIPPEFCRLPMKTLHLAKISKVLMALEQGRLAEFHGKNLDEITIGPKECVLETDEEDVNREEENHSLPDNEPSAEETLPPPPKRPKQRPQKVKFVVIGNRGSRWR
ncbi:uncharacterized protein LOC115438607 isoform X3 [Sphaeramia orbicularis]|uniref:uncharacterized protein LOC115438607 isoform X3 n=1 Tax=Sphaeramia orbicularis TaxID=375764 RepID=UPI0011810CCD|nr:uncharacterized protein LOC115438607 isoform X3 [Sphaeramia orbicularis]